MLEHRYGAILLSGLLTGDPIPELGDDATPQTIAFQASAFSPVDDIMVSGVTADKQERRVSIGVRRDPSFVPSDRPTVQLIAAYLRLLDQHWREIASGRWRLALAVASRSSHIGQVRDLATFARDTSDNDEFRRKLGRPGVVGQAVSQRLVYFDDVIAAAMNVNRLDIDATPDELTWRLLSALHLRELRLEGVDETDRAHAVGQLRRSTATGTAAAADRLLSRLVELAGRYASAGATKNLRTLRRDLAGYDLASATSAAGLLGASARPPVHSDYLSQVRRIAPVQLLAREIELTAMAEFALGAGPRSYLWWRGEAWTGKSALMSTFALNPPAGVRVVCFFITARFAGQGDRVAFGEVVLEQLLELLDEPMPTLLTDSTRDAHLIGTLTQAAELCSHSGERLLLLIDGLDEDQGVTTGPDAHSIASLLPADPPYGMRVIVSGRPNPPIPADVPESHPLRDSAVVRTLNPSPHSDAVRQDTERELKRLLHGTPAERDLLGLLAAAGGGLSGVDFAHLTGLPSWEIEDRLRAVSGRSFAPRTGHWRQDTTVYVLAHEELQQQAVRYLGESQLLRYRTQLHEWADAYRERGWPAGTPEYLLRGYYRMLRAERDLPRVLALATDIERHDRMLDIAGGDAAALAEIEAAQEMFLEEQSPSLTAMVTLAFHRDEIVKRNSDIPGDLPRVWARLARYDRAEALAYSIADPYRQSRALAAVAREAAAVGDARRVAVLCTRAEEIIPSIPDILQQCRSYADVARAASCANDVSRASTLITTALGMIDSLVQSQRPLASVDVARAWAAMGESAKANDLALSIESRTERSLALALVAGEIARSGLFLTALGIAESIQDRSSRAQGLSSISSSMSAAGDKAGAAKVARDAERLAGTIRNPSRQAWTLVTVAHAMADNGDAGQAMSLVRRVVDLDAQPGKQKHRVSSLIGAARVAAMCGEVDYAETVVEDLAGRIRWARASAAVAAGMADGGLGEAAEVAARRAELIARSAAGGTDHGNDLLTLAQVATQFGYIEAAVEIASAMADVSRRGRALTFVAGAVAALGELDRAERIAVSIVDPAQAAKALDVVAYAASSGGDIDRARRVAQLIADEDRRRRTLAGLDRPRPDADAPPAPADSSQPDGPPEDAGRDTVDIDVAAGQAIVNPFSQAEALTRSARGAAHRLEFERAQQILALITNEQLRARAFAAVAETVTRSGHAEQARLFVDAALAAMNSITTSTKRDQAIASTVDILARLGEHVRARRLVQSVVDPAIRARSLASLAKTAAAHGFVTVAESMAAELPDPATRATTLAAIAHSCANQGDLDRAEGIARTIVEPGPLAQALNAVVQAAGEIGDIDRALAVIDSIPDLAKQGEALTALAQRRQPEVAVHLLAAALHRGHWKTSLAAVGRIDPGAVRSLIEKVRAQLGRTP